MGKEIIFTTFNFGKGDLDMSGGISGPDHPVIFDSFSYPYGTTERFPQMEDSDLNVLSNTAHYYMECSNKGLCDRKTGECSCYDGYDGSLTFLMEYIFLEFNYYVALCL